MQQDSGQRTIIIATLSFIVGFGLAWLIAVNKDSSKSFSESEGSMQENEEVLMASGTDSVSVQDQTEGVRVTLGKVVLNDSAWVVIHEEDAGKPGRILGAQLFDKGTAEAGNVDLLRGTVTGKTYYAMLHIDNGDRAFDPKYDKTVTDTEGNTVMTSFKALSAETSQ